MKPPRPRALSALLMRVITDMTESPNNASTPVPRMAAAPDFAAPAVAARLSLPRPERLLEFIRWALMRRFALEVSKPLRHLLSRDRAELASGHVVRLAGADEHLRVSRHVQARDADNAAGHANERVRRVSGSLSGENLDEEYRPPNRGDRIRRANLNRLAGTHAAAKHAECNLPLEEGDRGTLRPFIEGQGGELANGDQGLAAEQDSHEGLLGRADLIPPVDVLLESEGEGG